MKKLILLLLFIPVVSFGQYSTYYGTYDVNADVNINQNVNVSGNVNKTLTTIDYGALAQANAQKEKNRLEMLKFENERDRQAAIEIISNPVLAIDYGKRLEARVPKDVKASGIKNGYAYGYKSFLWGFIVPHKSLFTPVKSDSQGWKFENISGEGIRTVVRLKGQIDVKNRLKKFKCESEECEELNNLLTKILSKNNLKTFVINQKEYEGKINNGFFVHKVSIGKASVQGAEGYKVIASVEDDFEKAITQDFYYSDGVRVILATSKVSADKDISFEQIEGRNFYLSPVIDKMVSTGVFSKLKF